ncbi:MAG TPA: M2 family metallopeptidase [Gemmatimonadaceae bacterium]|nr:M2 family metallopeptidase [Gemmatimonadaceae bacterium]
MIKRQLASVASILIASAGCSSPIVQSAAATASAALVQADAQRYLTDYERNFQQLYYASSLAEWDSNTRIVEGDTTNAARTKAANEAFARFVGSVENINRIRGLLENRELLTPLQVRQLEAMLYRAASQPQTAPEVVRARIAAETEQNERLYGYTFTVGGRAVTPNQIDSVLRTSTSLADRRAYWEASKAIGPTLKPGLVQLRDLRNRVVQALEYPDFFTYEVSDYDMSTAEMLALTENLNRQIRPLYRELHTWARHELARRYNAPVPDLIPAEWLPNRWGQDWSALVQVEGVNVDEALRTRTGEAIVRASEDFYVSLGFPRLPQSFWQQSSLYPLPADAPHKKNTHASAWHLDLTSDVRSLMSVEPNQYWWETSHHELGHVYYYIAYSNPEVPLVLRRGANRAYHEGIGSMIGLASSQRRFLANRGLISGTQQTDQMQQLLKEALNYVVFMPWSAGVMTRFEHDLYVNNLSPDRWNARWWELKRQYQGIAPPAARGEQFADGLTKTHINDDPAQYYDYALSFAILFQLHNHIARNILGQDPRDTDYFGNRNVGQFLSTLMSPGASRPWRDVLRETTGQEPDAQAMVEYFAPLYDWLRQQNQGRTHTLPAT